jgi:trimethyllysine dioxygenase
MNLSKRLQAFQLIQHNGQGGNTLLVDAFNCAQILKYNNPIDYEFLASTHIKGIYVDRKQQHHCSYSAPIIQENKINGSLYQIRYNSYNRYIPNHLDYDDTLKYYHAIKKFGEIIEDKANELWIRLEPGQLLLIDNYRVLHGRSAFTGNRELLTAYLPRDEWKSKARIFGLV